jgi:hypothetical protein
MPNNFTIQLATTEAQKQDAYKVRYEILSVECGNEKWANPINKTFTDPLDEFGKILNAYDDEKYIGTMRMVPRSSTHFLMEDAYAWDYFAKHLKDDHTRSVTVNCFA